MSKDLKTMIPEMNENQRKWLLTELLELLNDSRSGYKLRDKVLEVYRPLFGPTIKDEYLSHILSQCTLDILAIDNDLKDELRTKLREMFE